MELVDQFPVWLGLLYLGIEALKIYLPSRVKKKAIKEHSRDEVTDAVFKMYDLAKTDLESDKTEIRELTRLLRRANLEITILERKIAALMRVTDSLIQASPDTHKVYIDAMDKYAEEMRMLRKEGSNVE